MNNKKIIKNLSSKFIVIQGKDNASFLQGLITNDIYKCNIKNSIYSCLLTPQGKFLADFFISTLDNYFLIEIDEKYFKNFYNKLKIYKLRSDVHIEENINLKSFTYLTKNKPELNQIIHIFKDPRNINLGYRIYTDKNSKIFDKFNEINFNSYKELLIKNLIPYSPNDLIEEKSLLLENNFQNINAIDWNKGCYVGQELTARMKYRSLLKKKLYSLIIVSGKIDIGDKLILDNLIIGEVISRNNEHLLCMLKIDKVKKESEASSNLEIDNSIILKFL